MEKMKNGCVQKFTTVTKISKLLTLFLFITLPFIGFYFGIEYQKIKADSSDCADKKIKGSVNTDDLGPTYTLEKSSENYNDQNSFKYDLVRTDVSGDRKTIYSIINWFGFSYDVSDDDQYIAIINYGESSGDETLTIIKNNGQLVSNFEQLISPQGLNPMGWTEHFYWLYHGIPIGESVGVIRVDADTLKVDYYSPTL